MGSASMPYDGKGGGHHLATIVVRAIRGQACLWWRIAIIKGILLESGALSLLEPCQQLCLRAHWREGLVSLRLQEIVYHAMLHYTKLIYLTFVHVRTPLTPIPPIHHGCLRVRAAISY